MTREALGRRARVAPETIEAIETLPGRSAHVRTVQRLAKALGIPLGELLA